MKKMCILLFVVLFISYKGSSAMFSENVNRDAFPERIISNDTIDIVVFIKDITHEEVIQEFEESYPEEKNIYCTVKDSENAIVINDEEALLLDSAIAHKLEYEGDTKESNLESSETKELEEVVNYSDFGPYLPYVNEDRDGNKVYDAPFSYLGIPATNGTKPESGAVLLKGIQMKECLTQAEDRDLFRVVIIPVEAERLNPADEIYVPNYRQESGSTSTQVLHAKEILGLKPAPGYAVEVYWAEFYQGWVKLRTN